MPAGKRRMQPEEGDISNSSSEPKRVIAPHIDTCNSYAESISPAFNPKRVLLRRVFFIGADKTKNISIGFYPTKHYQPMVEIGAPDKSPLLLNDQQVRLMAEHLPRQIEALCNDEYYSCRIGEFKMKSCSPFVFVCFFLIN